MHVSKSFSPQGETHTENRRLVTVCSVNEIHGVTGTDVQDWLWDAYQLRRDKSLILTKAVLPAKMTNIIAKIMG